MTSPRRSKDGNADRKSRQEAASELAIAALTFIATDPEALGQFLALSGIDPQSIRAAAREPGFLRGVLDYLTADEQLLIAFASRNGIDPDDVARARVALAGEMPEDS
jgi:hypothetical protein